MHPACQHALLALLEKNCHETIRLAVSDPWHLSHQGLSLSCCLSVRPSVRLSVSLSAEALDTLLTPTVTNHVLMVVLALGHMGVKFSTDEHYTGDRKRASWQVTCCIGDRERDG